MTDTPPGPGQSKAGGWQQDRDTAGLGNRSRTGTHQDRDRAGQGDGSRTGGQQQDRDTAGPRHSTTRTEQDWGMAAGQGDGRRTGTEQDRLKAQDRAGPGDGSGSGQSPTGRWQQVRKRAGRAGPGDGGRFAIEQDRVKAQHRAGPGVRTEQDPRMALAQGRAGPGDGGCAGAAGGWQPGSPCPRAAAAVAPRNQSSAPARPRSHRYRLTLLWHALFQRSSGNNGSQ